MNIQSQPFLIPRSIIKSNDEETILTVGEEQLIFEGIGAKELLNSYKLFNGLHTLELISNLCKVDLEILFKLSKTLNENNFLIDTQAHKNHWKNGEDFVNIVIKECSFWRKHIYSQPFFGRLISGRLNSTTMLGWGIETMHYVEAANEYMALGVAYCRDNIKVREMLSQHYAHEENHSQIFLKGLIASGFEEKLLICAPPLASTRALINYLNEVALQNTLCYTAAFTLMQSGTENALKNDHENFYKNLTEKYPFADKMFEAFFKHALIDIELKHNKTLFEEIFNNREISNKEASNVVDVIRTLTRLFIQFFNGIEEYYSQSSCQIPRRQVRINCLLE
jgi:pyrroloquinoline quinone (PQQ) biosynthesis protein C